MSPASRLLLALVPLLAGLTAVAGRAQTLDDANALYAAGRLDDAIHAYRTVAERDATSDPAAAGTARNNLCVILMNGGRLAEARPDCAAALALRRAVGDEEGLAHSLNNLGLVEQYLGATADAEAHFDEALARNRRRGDAESQAINQANLGLLWSGAGRYRQALDAYRAVEDLAASSTAPWAAEQSRVARINEGVVLEKLGAYPEALARLASVRGEEAALDPDRRAALAANLGVIYRNLGDAEQAARELDRAVSAYRRLGERAALSNALLNRGLVEQLNLGDAGRAEPLFRAALELARASGDQGEEIQDLFYLGRLLAAEHRFDEAGTLLNRALELATRSGSAEGRWSALEALGRLQAARGDLAGAARRLDEAIAVLEEVRAGLAVGPHRAGFFGDKRSVYEQAVAIAVARQRQEPAAGHAEEAYSLVQRAKARELLDALGARATSPPQPRSAAAVARQLAGVPLLELFLGDSDVFAWWLAEDRVRLLPPQPAAPLLQAVERLHRSLARGAEPDPALLAELGQRLLGPLAAELRGAKRLRIAADGRLRYLPFELLPMPGGGALVDQVTVSYLPSGSTLAALAAPPAAPALELLALGDPQPGRRAESGAAPLGEINNSAYFDRTAYPPLPASAAELDTLGRWLAGPRDVRRGAAATEAAWRTAGQRGVRVVHFATHTVLDEREGRGAAILLTPEGNDDGLLEPPEIAGQAIPNELTVLSGCRTALGSAEDGRALSGLTGAFLAAGSRAVLASLWDVGDRASAAFMEQFYAELGEGRSPEEALAQVKRRLRADPRWNRATLWAPWVLIGEAERPLAPAGPRAWRRGAAVALGLLGIALLLGLGWRRRRRGGA